MLISVYRFACWITFNSFSRLLIFHYHLFRKSGPIAPRGVSVPDFLRKALATCDPPLLDPPMFFLLIIHIVQNANIRKLIYNIM